MGPLSKCQINWGDEPYNSGFPITFTRRKYPADWAKVFSVSWIMWVISLTLFHFAHFHAIQSATCELTTASSPLQCKGCLLATQISSAWSWMARRCCGEPAVLESSQQLSQMPQQLVVLGQRLFHRPLASGTRHSSQHQLAWWQVCLWRGLR